VVHLNEVSEKYREKGLTVVAISKQPKADLEKFVEELEAKFPIVGEKSDSMRAYGCTAYPSSFLVGPNGRIVWRGHPVDLKDDLLDATLEKTKLMPALSKGLSSHGKSLEKVKYGAVLAKLEADLAAARIAADEDRTCAEALKEWLAWYGTSTLEAADEQVKKGEVYRAFQALTDVESAFQGHELAARAKKEIAALQADKDRALEVKAGQMLDKIKAEIADESDAEKIVKALKPLLAKKYAETKAGKEAAALAEDPKGKRDSKDE
jgi:hypothetical protein